MIIIEKQQSCVWLVKKHWFQVQFSHWTCLVWLQILRWQQRDKWTDFHLSGPVERQHATLWSFSSGKHQWALYKSTRDACRPCVRCQLSEHQLHLTSPNPSFPFKCQQRSCLLFYLFICLFLYFYSSDMLIASSYLQFRLLKCLSSFLLGFLFAAWDLSF